MVHAAYHVGQQPKYLRYLNNEGGSLPIQLLIPRRCTQATGGSIDMEIDNNDDLFISHYALGNTLRTCVYAYQGTGQALTVHPTFDVSPPLPDGLTMNCCDGTDPELRTLCQYTTHGYSHSNGSNYNRNQS